MDSIDEVLGELPMPPYVTAEDVGFAVRAVTVHAAEQWPEGRAAATIVRRIRAGCTGGGRRVLDRRGLSDRQVQALIAEQEAPRR